MVIYLWPNAREDFADMRYLAADISMFPEGWELGYGPAHPPQGKHLRDESEGVFIQFDGEGIPAVATHTVLKYDNSFQASIFFFTNSEFAKSDAILSSWETPDGWSYRSIVANRFKFACAEMQVWDRFVSCKAVAQYDEYISIFQTPVSPRFMRMEDLHRLLKSIDERMGYFLKK
jgi:hypothetical protein